MTSTAMMTRAPRARVRLTGTGAVMSPSKYSRPSMRMRLNVPGTAVDARTAVTASPLENATGTPLETSVATTTIGMRKACNCCSPSWSRSSCSIWFPFSHGRVVKVRSPTDGLMSVSRMSASSAAASGFAAYSAPISAPMLGPTMMSGTIPAASNAFSTPTCAKPRGPPPPSTSATRVGVPASGGTAAKRGGAAPVYLLTVSKSASDHQRAATTTSSNAYAESERFSRLGGLKNRLRTW